MNWKKVAEEDLRNYNCHKTGMINIPEKLIALNHQMTAVKGSSFSSVPTRGGGTQMEDRLLDVIVEKSRLESTYQAKKRLVSMIEKGLSVLTGQERMVLDWMYITPRNNRVEGLMSELGYEKSQVYRLKDAALYKFTTAMYGLIDY